MNSLYHLLCRVLLLLLLCGVQQRTQATNTEHFAIQMDKSFYISGENVWYKIFLPTSYKGHEITLRVSLFDKEKSVHQQFFLSTEGKISVNGYLKIPFNWTSNIYQLTISGVKKASRKNIVLAYAPVTILNDQDRPQTPFPSSAHLASISTDSSRKIKIQLNPSNPTFLQQIDANLSIVDNKNQPIYANFSVAVREWNTLPEWNESVYGNMPINHPSLISPGQLAKHIYLFGKLTESSSSEEICTYIPQKESFIYTQIDEDDNFVVELPEFYGDLSVQFVSASAQTLTVDLLEPAVFSISSTTNTKTSAQISDYLENSRLRKKINMMYGQNETLTFTKTIDATSETSLISDRKIAIDDYASFPTLPIFLKEVPTTLKYKKGKDAFVFKMFNPGFRRREFYPGFPLFVVDGQIISDMDFIANLDMKNIKELDLFFDEGSLQRNFGDIGQGGVVYIQSRSGNLNIPKNNSQNELRINGFQYSPIYPIQVTAATPEIPIFRSLIYWNPNLRSNLPGETTFSFQHSHDQGKFLIEIVAHTDSGELLTEQFIYMVQ